MKNIQAQYQDLMEGRMTKANFMRNLRMGFPQFVSSTMNYDDAVNTMKGKKILSEVKKPEGVYGHNPNAENDLYRGIDHVNYYQMYHGLQYELSLVPEITDEAYVKARKKVVDKILKDPDAYKDLQLANFKAVKKMDKDLEMKEVKKDNLVDKPNEMKVVKKDAEASANTVKKDKKKKEKLPEMPVAPKPQKGVEAFPTPGKEKTLNESYDGGPDDLKKMAIASDKLRSNPMTVRIAKHVANKATNKDELVQLATKLARQEGIKDSEQITHIIDLAASLLKKESIQTLKEHLLDELTVPNVEHEHINVGSRVKKKGLDKYDPKGVGNVTEFDGDTATVKWDDDSVEHVQMNILTKKDIPQHPEAAEKFGKISSPFAKNEVEEGSDSPHSVKADHELDKSALKFLKNAYKDVSADKIPEKHRKRIEDLEASLADRKSKYDFLKEKSKIEKIKERLMKILKKEGAIATTAGGKTVASGKDVSSVMKTAKGFETSTGDQFTVTDTRTGKTQQV